jgi:hypothetical protein
MSQEYTPVDWVDETPNQPGTVINKARLDQMQTAHHFADGYEEVSTVPTADPGVSYHKVVLCTADMIFYRWNGTAWEKVIDNTVWPWQSDIIYYQGSVVLYNGYMYVSLVDNNIGHQPHGDDAYWQLTATQGPQGPPGEVVSAGDMVIRYIGDGFSTTYDVIHNLGTTKVIYSMQSGGEFIDATVSVVDEDTLRVKFHTPPTANAVTMAIYSGGLVNIPTADQYIYDQSTPASVWNISHGKDRHVQVQIQDTAGTVIFGKITEVDLNNVKIEFNAATAGTAIIE